MFKEKYFKSLDFQDSDGGGNTCPFCRYEIKGTNRVIIDRFKPTPVEIEKAKNVAAAEKKLISLVPDVPPRTVSTLSTATTVQQLSSQCL